MALLLVINIFTIYEYILYVNRDPCLHVSYSHLVPVAATGLMFLFLYKIYYNKERRQRLLREYERYKIKTRRILGLILLLYIIGTWVLFLYVGSLIRAHNLSL